ncbi:hypothetical protein [Methylocystis parvus]|uniref:Uncharacterized protein n=1 Tax=Methylocystis parvus TaxID=134 RepID=A0A6B8M6M8_9HYPH|nr:hypothetical protein [Methylocystis parvus]QGM97995.1 hypothetical protein F7D14_11250 [Methylocystis parvus]WBK01690.1 hypothetical protein MMG94_08320 [Methylocystis parvus OBBP]
MFGKLDFSEVVLRGAGALLAAASSVFAFRELSDSNQSPRIAGMEHLAIYAKPATRASAPPRREDGPGIDYAPVGSTRKRTSSRATLETYEIVDASPESAVIRLPEGRIIRIAPGSRIAGLGEVLSIRQDSRKWTVVTQSGAISEN